MRVRGQFRKFRARQRESRGLRRLGAGGSPIFKKEMQDDVDDGNRANDLQQMPAEYDDWIPRVWRQPFHNILGYVCRGWPDWFFTLVIRLWHLALQSYCIISSRANGREPVERLGQRK